MSRNSRPEHLCPRRGLAAGATVRPTRSCRCGIRSASHIPPISKIFRMCCAYPGCGWRWLHRWWAQRSGCGFLGCRLSGRHERRTPICYRLRQFACKLHILVFTFAGVSIAVAWHRRIILGEQPGFSGSNVATKSLWRYDGVGFAIGLIAFLPSPGGRSADVSFVVFPSLEVELREVPGADPGDFSGIFDRLCPRAAPELVASGARGRKCGLDVQRDVETYPRKHLADDLGHSRPACSRRRSSYLDFLVLDFLVRAYLPARCSPVAWPSARQFSPPTICSLSQSGSAFCLTPTRISSSGRDCNAYGEAYRQRTCRSP